VKRSVKRQWFKEECAAFRQFPAFMKRFQELDP